MVHQLVGKLVKQGVNVQANTPVTSVSPTADESGRYTIQTTRGAIKAPKIVYATNGFSSQLLPEYTKSITPIRGVCSHIASPKKKNSPHLVNTYALRFNDRNFDYLIPRADGSIIVGGATKSFWADRKRWFDTVRDDELVDEALPHFDGYMQRYFRGWEDSDAKVEKIWTGSKFPTPLHAQSISPDELITAPQPIDNLFAVMGYTADFVPHIGNVPDRPGQYIIAGFNGHGMPQILLSTKGLAAMVRNEVPFEQTGIPRVFKTSKERIMRKDSPLEDSLRPLWGGGVRAKL
jgi:glycine/D-amino acid oxidase-like deaminating enzyme